MESLIRLRAAGVEASKDGLPFLVLRAHATPITPLAPRIVLRNMRRGQRHFAYLGASIPVSVKSIMPTDVLP